MKKLAGRLFLLFYLDDFPPVVGPAGGAGMMGQFGAVALGANIQCRWFQGTMAQPVTGT
jgi:hypothetical protein